MPRAQQDILVKIKVLLEGLGNVRALAGHIKELNSGGGGQTAALAGNVDRLALAVDRLASASAKTEKSRGGFVRFLVGISAVVNTLATLPQAFEGLNKLIDFLDNIGGGIGAAFGKVKAAASSLFSSVSQAASGVASQAGAAFSGLGGAAGGLGAALAAALPVVLAIGAALAVVVGVLAAAAAGFISLAASVGVGAVALTFIAQRGLEVHRSLEQVRLGIAAIITSLGDVKVNDLPVEGAEKFRAAMVVSGEQLKKLQVDAVNTVATFEQIAPAFQAALAPGLAAKLTLDEIREITVKVVQAASAIGLPLDQVNQEVRALLDGTINEDARLAKVLGISNEMVKSWKAQGKLAEELNKRLAGFAVAGVEAAQTMDGLTSNLEEALNVFSTEATGRAFAALKGEFARLLPQLFDFKSAGISAQFKGLAELADEVLVRIIRIAGGIAQNIVSGLRQASAFIQRNRTQIDGVLTQVEVLIRLLVQAVGVVAQIATSSATWGSTLGVVRGVLGLINVILATILQQFRQMAPYLQLAIVAANLLIASQPGLSAFAQAGTVAGRAGANQQDLDNDLERLRSKQAGSITVGALPRAPGGGGGKGGGGRQSQVRELTRALEEAKIDTALSRFQAKAELIKQDIEASIQAVRDGLEDSILSISDAFRLEAALADKYLATERDRLREEIAAAQARRDLAVKNLDPKLSADERRLAIAAEDEKLAGQIVKLEGERDRLTQETLDKKAAIVRAEALAREELARSIADIEAELAGLAPSAQTRIDVLAQGIEDRFKDVRERLEAEVRAGSKTAEEALERLQKLIGGLSDRAKFDVLAGDAGAKLDELRDLEELLSVGVSQGTIKSRDAAKRRLELEREYKRALLDTISGLAEIARRTGDPELAAAVRQLQIEWAKLGNVIDETAKRIDDTLRGGLEDTLVSIITRTETVGEAFRKLAQTILAEIARIVAANLVEKIFGGLLNTGSGNSIGNILSGILNGGSSKPSSGGARPGSGIENIPLIIRNFQSSAVGNLTGIKGNTFGTVSELRSGFGQVGSKFQEVISFLPNLLPPETSLLRTALQAAVQVAGAAASAVANKKLGARADGGFITGPGTGTSDSILARLSNGEFVIREWAARMIGPDVLHFLNTFGRLPALQVPQFAAGGFPAGDFPLSNINPPEGMGGDSIELNMPVTIQTKDAASFKQSEQAIKRTIGRTAQDGLRRAKTRPR
jgi:hypothetical protein